MTDFVNQIENVVRWLKNGCDQQSAAVELQGIADQMRVVEPRPAHEREPPHCSTCSCGLQAEPTVIHQIPVTMQDQDGNKQTVPWSLVVTDEHEPEPPQDEIAILRQDKAILIDALARLRKKLHSALAWKALGRDTAIEIVDSALSAVERSAVNRKGDE